MRRIAAAAIVAVSFGAASDASAKPRRADLTVRSAGLAGTPALGVSRPLRVTIRNRGKAPARATRLSAGLAGKSLARKRVRALKPGRSATVELSLAFPKTLAPGRYVIVVCADAAKAVKEASETNNCRKLAKALTVATPLPANPGAGRGQPPPPGPAPTPAPTATPTP